MKIIKGHKSRNQGEIIEILLRDGAYTCPTLRHYRYDGVRVVCRKLQLLGLIKKKRRNPESVNLVVTELFLEWKAERAGGTTDLGAERWLKARRQAGRKIDMSEFW